MSTEEDTELRDLVIDSLEKKGILGKIKAELRATVFLALEETNLEKCKISFQNETLQKYAETTEGKIVVSLVRDFLQHFHLDYTLAVFEPEVSLEGKFLTTEDLLARLNIKTGHNQSKAVPLISHLLNDVQKSSEQGFVPRILGKILDSPTKTKQSSDFADVQSPKSDNLEETNSSGVNEDNFFDVPVPSNEKEPLLFSFLGKSASQDKNTKKGVDSPKPEPTDPTGDLTFVKPGRKATSAEESPIGLTSSKAEKSVEEKEKSLSALSSLKDLPLLQQSVPQVRRKGSDDYDDDFQSSKSQSVKSSGKKDLDDTEASIEEEIEDEDLSAAANDILNSLTSQGEDVTSDHSISQMSGGGYDYMEKIS